MLHSTTTCSVLLCISYSIYRCGLSAFHSSNAIHQSNKVCERHLGFLLKMFLLKVLINLPHYMPRSFPCVSLKTKFEYLISLLKPYLSVIMWLTVIKNTFFIYRGFSFYWPVVRDSRFRWEVMMWKAVVEEGVRVRGPWQLSHTNIRLPLWMDTWGLGDGVNLPHCTAAIGLSLTMLSCPLIWTG